MCGGLPQRLPLFGLLPGKRKLRFQICPFLLLPGKLCPEVAFLAELPALLQQPVQGFRGRPALPDEGLAPLQPPGAVLLLLRQQVELLLHLSAFASGPIGLPLGFSGPEQRLLPFGEPGELLGQGNGLLPELSGGFTPLPGLCGLRLQRSAPFPCGHAPSLCFLPGVAEPLPGLRRLQQSLSFRRLPLQLFLPGAEDGFPLLCFPGGLLQLLPGFQLLLFQQGALSGAQLAEPVFQRPGAGAEAVGQRLPPLGGKQGAEHLPLLLGIGPEQPEKLSLGQDDDLGKLFAGQVQKLLRLVPHGGFAPALQQPPFAAFQYKAFVGVPQLRFLCIAVDVDKPGPPEAVHAVQQGEFIVRQRGDVVCGPHAAHGIKAPAPAGGPAVKGKAHGVQQGGFSPAGGAGNEK